MQASVQQRYLVICVTKQGINRHIKLGLFHNNAVNDVIKITTDTGNGVHPVRIIYNKYSRYTTIRIHRSDA